jgi:hypothetical protein
MEPNHATVRTAINHKSSEVTKAFLRLFLSLSLAFVTLTALGCSAPADNTGSDQDTQAQQEQQDEQPQEQPLTSKSEEIWLDEVENPFYGTWISDIPSANATLTFDFKQDGTFDFELSGVPADQGGKGSGGYTVFEDVQVSYLDFEGAAGYVFKVVDNNTIDVTEILGVAEDGTKELGNTAPFIRAEGTVVKKDDCFLKLNNPLIGKIEAFIPSADATLTFEYKANGTFDFEMDGVPADQGGKGSGGYTVFEDVLVSYLDFEGMASYEFKVLPDDSIDVTEILGIAEDGSRELGNTSNFKHV